MFRREKPGKPQTAARAWLKVRHSHCTAPRSPLTAAPVSGTPRSWGLGPPALGVPKLAASH